MDGKNDEIKMSTEARISNRAYHEIMKKMSQRPVVPPDDLDDQQLLFWLLGHTAAYDELAEIVRQLRERNRSNGNYGSSGSGSAGD
jgi:hypothetical protein